jgi:hypothetical protein
MKSFVLLLAGLFWTMNINPAPKQNGKSGWLGPPAIVYKTKGDYNNNVPVTLSEDKSKIVSYPAPVDLYYRGKLAYPTKLAKGFLLDNRGISPNTVFLKITYEEYSKLNSAPAMDELMKMIIDTVPFTEMYNLGVRNRFKNEVEEIDSIIKKHKLDSFQCLINVHTNCKQ